MDNFRGQLCMLAKEILLSSMFITKPQKTSRFIGKFAFQVFVLDVFFHEYILALKIEYFSFLLNSWLCIELFSLNLWILCFVEMDTGMEWSNQEIHGLMVRNTSHNVRSSQGLLLRRGWYYRKKKVLYGGTLIVTGRELLSMALFKFTPNVALTTPSQHLIKTSPSS